MIFDKINSTEWQFKGTLFKFSVFYIQKKSKLNQLFLDHRPKNYLSLIDDTLCLSTNKNLAWNFHAENIKLKRCESDQSVKIAQKTEETIRFELIPKVHNNVTKIDLTESWMGIVIFQPVWV